MTTPVDFGEVDLRRPISPKSAARLTLLSVVNQTTTSPSHHHSQAMTTPVDFGEVDLRRPISPKSAARLTLLSRL